MAGIDVPDRVLVRSDRETHRIGPSHTGVYKVARQSESVNRARENSRTRGVHVTPEAVSRRRTVTARNDLDGLTGQSQTRISRDIRMIPVRDRAGKNLRHRARGELHYARADARYVVEQRHGADLERNLHERSARRTGDGGKTVIGAREITSVGEVRPITRTGSGTDRAVRHAKRRARHLFELVHGQPNQLGRVRRPGSVQLIVLDVTRTFLLGLRGERQRRLRANHGQNRDREPSMTMAASRFDRRRLDHFSWWNVARFASSSGAGSVLSRVFVSVSPLHAALKCDARGVAIQSAAHYNPFFARDLCLWGRRCRFRLWFLAELLCLLRGLMN